MGRVFFFGGFSRTIVLALTDRARGWMDVPLCFSIRVVRIPWWLRKRAALNPTTPPPTMRTGTCVESRSEDIATINYATY